MKTINAYQLQKLNLPVDGYSYIVETWRSVDNGKTFAYCGESKYFRTEEEAAAYKAAQEETAGAPDQE